MATTGSSDSDYHCEAYQPEDFVDGNGLVCSTKSLLFIEFYVSVDGFTKHDNLTLPISDITSWSVVLSSMLSQLYVPFDSQVIMIMTITNCARSIINEHRNMNCHVIPMVVMITAVSYNEEEEEEEEEEEAVAQAATLSINGQALDMVPASESSVQALKKTGVEDCSRRCVICLEDIFVGSEATSMPCSHQYHQDCIVKWLKQCNLCPLCRFRMPVKS